MQDEVVVMPQKERIPITTVGDAAVRCEPPILVQYVRIMDWQC